MDGGPYLYRQEMQIIKNNRGALFFTTARG